MMKFVCNLPVVLSRIVLCRFQSPFEFIQFNRKLHYKFLKDSLEQTLTKNSSDYA